MFLDPIEEDVHKFVSHYKYICMSLDPWWSLMDSSNLQGKSIDKIENSKLEGECRIVQDTNNYKAAHSIEEEENNQVSDYNYICSYQDQSSNQKDMTNQMGKRNYMFYSQVLSGVSSLVQHKNIDKDRHSIDKEAGTQVFDCIYICKFQDQLNIHQGKSNQMDKNNYMNFH